MPTLAPIDIDPKAEFGDSGWQNCETEIVARNIVSQQRAADPQNWTTFTLDDYVRFCKRNVAPQELQVIEALAYGGSPAWNSRTQLKPGYLTVDRDGQYKVTAMFLQAIPASAILASVA
jgi:hypothetical protein